MNATQGDVQRSAFDQTPIVGVDHRLDDLVFEVAFFAAVRGDFQRIQQGRISRPAYAALGNSQRQLEFAEGGGYRSWMLAIAPLSDSPPMAKTVFRIAFSNMTPEPLSHLARWDDTAVMAQALCD